MLQRLKTKRLAKGSIKKMRFLTLTARQGLDLAEKTREALYEYANGTITAEERMGKVERALNEYYRQLNFLDKLET